MKESEIESIYNSILDNQITRLVGRKVTYGSQLEKAGFKLLGTKFRGVFPSDKIPKLNQMVPYAILNVDKSYQGGSHWVAVAFDNGELCFYDSFGRKASKLMPSVLKSGNGKVVDSDLDAEQKESEEDCGAKSIAWLVCFEKYGRENAMKI